MTEHARGRRAAEGTRRVPGGSRGRGAGGGERHRRHRPQALVSRRDRCRRRADRVEGHAAQGGRRGRLRGSPEGASATVARVLQAMGVQTGVRVVTQCRVPEGSGLGESSALAAAVAGALARVQGAGLDRDGIARIASEADAPGAARRPACGRATPPSAAGSWPFTRRRRACGWRAWRSTRPASRSRSCWSTPGRPDLPTRVTTPRPRSLSIASRVRDALLAGRFEDADRPLGRGVGGPPRAPRPGGRRPRPSASPGSCGRRAARPGCAGPERAGSWRCGPLPALAGRAVGRPWWRRRRRPACGSSRRGWIFAGWTWSEAGRPSLSSQDKRAIMGGLTRVRGNDPGDAAQEGHVHQARQRPLAGRGGAAQDAGEPAGDGAGEDP